MAQHGFAQFGSTTGGNIDPNDLMSSGYSPSFSSGNNFNSASNQSNGFSSGSAVFGDDELLDGLASPGDNMAGQDFGGMNIGFNQGNFG